MKKINYKGKGNHSVNELELIIEQHAEELHLLKSGQMQLPKRSPNNFTPQELIEMERTITKSHMLQVKK